MGSIGEQPSETTNWHRSFKQQVNMYDLHKLGWNSFQQLCLTITREILGQTVESFLDTSDGGRDGAFIGTWKAEGQENLSGAYVIQCKFTSKANHVLKVSDLSDETKKARKLVERGLCESYVLMTNAGLTGTVSSRVKELFESAGVKHFRVFGVTWINQQILENKRLRMLVPRVYGLGDLSQILDERAYIQARAILESMREDLAKVVVTDAYKRAAAALDKYSFVLLIGEPAAGKTTIASLLAMAAIDQWNVSTLKLDHPDLVVERWNPNEPSQFYWMDDAFGVTQYEGPLVRRWNHVLSRIPSMLGRGAKIVMTSRDYIYNRARRDLKVSVLPLLEESQVVIHVHDLSTEEKRQILYNHLKLGEQPRSFRAQIKPHLEGVAGHGRFIPEVARRLGTPFFTRDLTITASNIDQFVERREELLKEILLGLDFDSKAALALIYMRNGRLESPIRLQPSEQEALDRLGSRLGGCVDALEALRDSLVVLSRVNGEAVWEFRHPTVGDAFGAILVQNAEYLGIFIKGSAPERLMQQVTCGNVGVDKAVVVPTSLYAEMVDKLEEVSGRKSGAPASTERFFSRWTLQSFLAHRCSKAFLSLYLQRNPGLFEAVSDPGLSLELVPEVPLAVRLHEVGLLPEEHRKRFVQTVSEYALQGIDGLALRDQGIQGLFTDDEFEDFLQRVQTDVLVHLDSIRGEWESDYSQHESPEQHMDGYLTFLESLSARFGDDKGALRQIEEQRSLTYEWIDETKGGEFEEEDTPQLGAVELPDNPKRSTKGTRSIFDDIDADEVSPKD